MLDARQWKDLLDDVLRVDWERLSHLLGRNVAAEEPRTWVSTPQNDEIALYGCTIDGVVAEDGSRSWLVVSVDDAEYLAEEGEWAGTPSGKISVRVEVCLRPRSHGRLDAAHRAVESALDEHLAPRVSLKAQPVGHPCMLDLPSCKWLRVDDSRAVWLSVVSRGLQSFEWQKAPMQPILQAAPDLTGAIDELLMLGLRARGAIDGGRPDLSTEVLAGWCGEFVASRHPATEGLMWLGGNAVIDFVGQARSVEVKSTITEAPDGRAHFSEEQVRVFAERGEVALLAVRVPPAVVDALRVALKVTGEEGVGALPAQWIRPFEHLSAVTHLNWVVLEARWPAIVEALAPLDDADVHIGPGPRVLGMEVLQALSRATASLSLPFGLVAGEG
ncbi:MAG: hypothetical protein H6741_27845 [Alphaproteobacteria bacterium]|nr:hypothetical protein [Alphaproteobacteria bacterium]MCB9796528.1 hypothetical protein [Alphaproteobacteria bacterium]